MLRNLLEPLVEIFIVGKKVSLRIENLTGREVIKLIPVFKKLGRVKNLSEIIGECRKNLDRYVNFSFCG
jgi:hypothetical protein